MAHGLGWEDGGMVGVHRCGDYSLITHDQEFILENGEKPKRCPHCGRLLRLVWKVYVEEVPD